MLRQQIDHEIETVLLERDARLFGDDVFPVREKWSDAARAASSAARRTRRGMMRDKSRPDVEGLGKFTGPGAGWRQSARQAYRKMGGPMASQKSAMGRALRREDLAGFGEPAKGTYASTLKRQVGRFSKKRA